ncbi:tRNA (adenine(22)-N(1))-methyltransferase [Oenococcus alcoholitolerans]|uniref:tRNA (adenine(22)-N(1))-methyltransferase n=1 Tax=Oenococcus alcoholitolerans TaxID=931074 RepID=UPI003F6FA3F2
MAKLSDRLLEIYRFIPENTRVADIGTDHAAIPIALVETQKSDFILATDIGNGPLSQAKEQIELADLEEQQDYIHLRLGDGLKAIKESDKIETIVISGIGGELMSNILSNMPDFLLNCVFILEPNNEQYLVRKCLDNLGFSIDKESIIYEKGHFYEVIVGSHDMLKKNLLNEEDYFFGPILRKRKSKVFLEKWNKELNRLLKLSEILNSRGQKETLRYHKIIKKIKMLRGILR